MLIPTWNPKKKILIHNVLLIVLGVGVYFGSTAIHHAVAKKETVSCQSLRAKNINPQEYYDTRQKGYTKLYVNKDGKVCTR